MLMLLQRNSSGAAAAVRKGALRRMLSMPDLSLKGLLHARAGLFHNDGYEALQGGGLRAQSSVQGPGRGEAAPQLAHRGRQPPLHLSRSERRHIPVHRNSVTKAVCIHTS